MAMIADAADGTALSLLFHLNSAAWGRGGVEFDPNATVPRKVVLDPRPILLPDSDSKSQIATVAARRRSCRQYTARTMSLAVASTLLRSCYGVTDLRFETPSWARWGRPVPSAGGLYPLEVFVALQNVEGAPDGVFHYEPIQDSLSSLSSCRLDDIKQAIFSPEFIANANMLVMFAGTFAATQKKYGPRGYRYILIEAGHAAQNLCLTATELGCGSLCLGGFYDDRLNRSLALDELEEGVLYCIGIGYPEA
jgi:SagB-type dehydrogenase family enzyme